MKSIQEKEWRRTYSLYIYAPCCFLTKKSRGRPTDHASPLRTLVISLKWKGKQKHCWSQKTPRSRTHTYIHTCIYIRDEGVEVLDAWPTMYIHHRNASDRAEVAATRWVRGPWSPSYCDVQARCWRRRWCVHGATVNLHQDECINISKSWLSIAINTETLVSLYGWGW